MTTYSFKDSPFTRITLIWEFQLPLRKIALLQTAYTLRQTQHYYVAYLRHSKSIFTKVELLDQEKFYLFAA